MLATQNQDDLEVENFNILVANTVDRADVHHRTKFYQKSVKRFLRYRIFPIFKMAAVHGQHGEVMVDREACLTR